MLAAADGRRSAVVETGADEVAGVNSRSELALVEAEWQRRRRLAAMTDGVTLIAPETVWFSHDTAVGRDVVVEPNVVFGPGVQVEDGVVIHAFRSEEHTSELQSLMRISYAVLCLKKKTNNQTYD